MRRMVTILVVLGVLGAGLFWLKGDRSQTSMMAPAEGVAEMTPEPAFAPYTARFEIVTNGTKRVFTDSMYHRQSPEVFVDTPDPQLVRVMRPGLTWSDFFETLPFELDSKCLVTGTKQRFCTDETGKLYFYLNDQEVPEALERVIAPEDTLRVVFLNKN